MNTKGYTVGTYTIKTEKKNSELPMCPICKKCKDRSICQNRKDKKSMSKCDKCKKCKDADKCDKFYINEQHKATLTIGKDIETGEAIRKSFTAKTQEEALDKMYKYKLEIKKSGGTIELKRTEKTIAILAKEIEDSKYRMGKTKANAYNTNMSTLERIKKHTFATRCIEAGVDLPVLQKLMGHANIETTINTYGDIYNYYKQKETQKVIDYLKRERA